jgi:HEAT repeat protein
MLTLLFFLVVFAQDPMESLTGAELIELTKTVNPERLPNLFDKIASLKHVGDQEMDVLISFLSDERRAIVGQLVSADVTVSRYAADALVEIGSPSVPKLRDLLVEGTNNDVQVLALMILGRIGLSSSETQDTVELIIRKKSESLPDQELVAAAVFALGRTAKDRNRAVKTLLDIPTGSESSVRAEIAWSLSVLGIESELAIERLISFTWDKAPTVQKAAINALGQIGAGNSAAKERLMQIITYDAAKFARVCARVALENLENEEKKRPSTLKSYEMKDEKSG